MDSPSFKLPSPTDEVHYPALEKAGVRLWVKRDDLIHPDISGNKWRKLKYNVEKALVRGNRTLLTLGGAFSNHIAATAAAGGAFGLQTIGVIRGEDADLNNPTLGFARKCGMHIHPISRARYGAAETWEFVESLKREFGTFYYIPQGGANDLGAMGCMDILKENTESFDRIFLSCGTGTTAAGLVMAGKGQIPIHAVSALKNGGYLAGEIRKLVAPLTGDSELADEMMDQLHLDTEHHFGGYARTTDALVAFMRHFHAHTGIKLDPIYTGKAAFAMTKFAENYPAVNGEKWLFIHTGGLQGIPSMERKWGFELYPDC